MTRDAALSHRWRNGETIYIVELKTYTPKNPFYVNQDGRSTIEFYYPTGNILELPSRHVEFSFGEYVRASFLDINDSSYDSRNHSIHANEDSDDTLNLYNYHFNKFFTKEDALRELPKLKEQLRKINMGKYDHFKNRSVKQVDMHLETISKYFEDQENLDNIIESWS